MSGQSVPQEEERPLGQRKIDLEDHPVTISIVGTGDANGGGVAPTPHGTIATTPGTQPNLLINVITPAVAVTVRAVTSFLTAFSGVLTVAGLGGSKLFAATDLHGVLVIAFWTGVGAAVTATVKNLITVFGRLEGKYPLATGSI